MKNISLFFALLVLVSCSKQEQTFLGPVDLSSPVLKTLHDSHLMQRLKGIDQSGSPYYYCNGPKFSRFDHSMGVLYLVQHYGGSEIEQAAALTHDASHTVFSHVSDVLFDKEGYQDSIHESSLKAVGVDDLLKPYGITIHQISPDQEHFKRLEQPLPDMCADRIEYNLHTAFNFGLLSKEEITYILNHLFFDNDKWYFDDAKAAELFARQSLTLTEYVWAAPNNVYVYHLTAKMLKHALGINLINQQMLHFGKDQDIVNILNQSNDPEIVFYKNQIQSIDLSNASPSSNKVNVRNKQADKKLIKPKFRGINPFVLKGNSYLRLSEIDENYKKSYHNLKKKLQKGFWIDLPQF